MSPYEAGRVRHALEISGLGEALGDIARTLGAERVEALLIPILTVWLDENTTA